jgi:YD repeat-containing protein
VPYGTRFRPDIIRRTRELTDLIMSQIETMSGIQRQYDTTGREGLVAGPGGYPSREASDALAAWQSWKLTAPSPVGGVYLGGGGRALEGFGYLRGVAIDEASGKLVLVGSDEHRIALPPLRLEDIVTVFRAVFDHGQAPTVTIDPDAQQPTGPILHVKHGPGTASSYVGWILYECDRVMKTYHLGRDNITGATMSSRAPGYATTLDAVYFGNSASSHAPGGTWERFWIVPAEVIRFDASTDDLSLFQLPLKVNTQKMRWEHGRLVDDPRGVSSFGARTFQQWFSDQYDAIADEVLMSPPIGSGLDTPVPIFHELRRIAAIAAVAERLRDLGHTLPTWMRDYPVAPFPVPLTTPSLTLRQTKESGSGMRVAQIYGGVNLAPADRDVYAYRDDAGAPSASVARERRAFVEAAANTAKWLAPKIEELARSTESAAVKRVSGPDGTELSVVTLPGSTTRALAPNRQEVSDLVIPIGGGRQIGLTRSYNSFFDPSGEFGRGWTLDLPQVNMTPVPVRRDGARTEYRLVPHVSSPLGTIDMRIDPAEPTGEHLQVIRFTRSHSAISGAEARQLVFRDGTIWHFDDDGRLLLVQDEGAATRYIRDRGGRLVQIVGYVGTDAVAEITLKHDEQGRIIDASATQTTQLRNQAPALTSRVTFEYGENGRLVRIKHPPGRYSEPPRVHWSYNYNAHRLMTIGGSVDASFGYDERGRLLWEQHGNQKTQYTLTSTSQQTVLRKGTGTHEETWTFDPRMRPLEVNIGGEIIRWQYGAGSEVTETLTQAGRSVATRSISQDGSTATTVIADGPTYRVQRDAFGRPTNVSVDGIEAAHLSWGFDGSLAAIRIGDTEVHPRRATDGRNTGVLITAPMDRGRTTHWLEQIWDVMRRPTTIRDSSGFEYRIDYDERGRVLSAGRITDRGMLVGSRLAYDGNDRIARIQSSWGTETRAYSEAGLLSYVELTNSARRLEPRFTSVSARPGTLTSTAA